MMLSLYEIARKTQIPPTSLYRSLSQGVSIKRASVLEKITCIHKVAWLFPEDFFNPYCPYRYQGKYPPSLDHLSGEALEFAKKIIKAFPERPPTKEEFKKFKKELRRRQNAKDTNKSASGK